jgi:SAM-dependent methyltransferase
VVESIILGVMDDKAEYLEPYRAAARRHGAGFGSLLWASRQTQAVRFDAMTRIAELEGRRVLDVGCGRADLLDYLIEDGVRVESYVGIEAVAELAEAARAKGHENAQIIEADFVAEPHRLFVGAQVVAISGALNTLDASGFYATLRRAYEAASEALVFNFLSSERLAGASYLAWHPLGEVMGFVGTLSERVMVLEDYLMGDCTVAVGKGF